MDKRNRRGGFTLIELIVVIAIIVILIALIAPNASRLIASARQTAADANAKTVYTAAQVYLVDKLTSGEDVTKTALTMDDVREYLTGDAAKGVAEVKLENGAAVSATWQASADSDVVGTYPKSGTGADLSDTETATTGLETLKTSQAIQSYISGLTFFNKDNNKTIDSTAPASDSALLGAGAQINLYLKDAGVSVDSAAWMIYKAKKADTDFEYYWTNTDITKLTKGDTVTAYKYSKGSDGTYAVTTSTMKIATKKMGSTTYNVLDRTSFK